MARRARYLGARLKLRRLRNYIGWNWAERKSLWRPQSSLSLPSLLKCGNGGAKLEGGQKYYSRDYFGGHLYLKSFFRDVQFKVVLFCFERSYYQTLARPSRDSERKTLLAQGGTPSDEQA